MPEVSLHSVTVFTAVRWFFPNIATYLTPRHACCMGSNFELTPPTDLHITRQDDDVLELRTGVGSWWLGGLGLIALAGVLVGGIGSFAYALWHLRFLAAISALVGTALASAFLALFAGALLHEWLLITGTGVAWSLRLFSFTLWRKAMSYADITSVEVVDVGNDDGPGYKLEFIAGKVSARLSGGSTRENLDRLRSLIITRWI